MTNPSKGPYGSMPAEGTENIFALTARAIRVLKSVGKEALVDELKDAVNSSQSYEDAKLAIQRYVTFEQGE